MREDLNIYWRNEWFESLKEVSKLAKARPYENYRKYCIHLENGLRKQALEHLSNFIVWIKMKKLSERLEFLRWILPIADKSPNFEQLVPYPLSKKVAEPTLNEFINLDGGDADTFYWLGILTKDSLYLKRAIAMDSDHVDSRLAMINRCLNFVDFATHHLPEYFIGDIHEVIEEMNYAESLIIDIIPTDNSAHLKNEIRIF